MLILALLAPGVICLVGAYLLLRSLGIRYRVGRLLAAAPTVDIAQAVALAQRRPKYVKVSGRISSDEEFPDDNERPLVFRRKRIQVEDGKGGWRTLAEENEAVPFGVETRDEFIAVDESAISDGLVAIPREAAGKLSDLPADLVDGIEDLPPADTPARLLIEQLSAVEHATVCGTPVMRNGQPTMTAGLRRPLVITILAPPEAMRLLATGNRPRVLAAAALIIVAAGFGVATLVAVIAGY